MENEQMYYAQQEEDEDSMSAQFAQMSPLHVFMVTTPVCLMIYFCITQRADRRRNQAEEQSIMQNLAIAVVVGVLFFGGALVSNLAGQVLAPLGFIGTAFLPLQLALAVAMPLAFLSGRERLDAFADRVRESVVSVVWRAPGAVDAATGAVPDVAPTSGSANVAASSSSGAAVASSESLVKAST